MQAFNVQIIEFPDFYGNQSIGDMIFINKSALIGKYYRKPLHEYTHKWTQHIFLKETKCQYFLTESFNEYMNSKFISYYYKTGIDKIIYEKYSQYKNGVKETKSDMSFYEIDTYNKNALHIIYYKGPVIFYKIEKRMTAVNWGIFIKKLFKSKDLSFNQFLVLLEKYSDKNLVSDLIMMLKNKKSIEM